MAAPVSRADLPLVEALAARSPSDNVPLWLAVARRHAARRTPRDIRGQWAADSFVRPSALDLRTAHAFDAIALDATPDFEAVLLSPVAPLGVCGAVSPSSQDRIVTTSRGSEVVSDPTNVMALLAAERLERGAAEVRLCSLGQVVRAQRYPSRPGFTQHFRLLTTVEAGAALPDHGFEVASLARHVAMFLDLFARAGALGCTFPNVRATILETPARRPVAERLRARIAASWPELVLAAGPEPSPYYDGLRVLVGASGPDGAEVQLGDIGLFDWMAKLTSNKKRRMVASGMGLQLFPLLFRGAPPAPTLR